MSDMPSPLRSPEPATCQAAPLAGPTIAADEIVEPFISQAAAWPDVLPQMRSALPSPLRSPTAFTDQVDPLAGPMAAAEVMLVPFISHSTAWPEVFCTMMSAKPSPLKSSAGGGRTTPPSDPYGVNSWVGSPLADIANRISAGEQSLGTEKREGSIVQG